MTSPEHLKQMIDKDLGVMMNEIGKFVRDHDLVPKVEDIALPETIEAFQQAIIEMLKDENKARYAVQAFTALNALDAQLAYLNTRFNYLASIQAISQAISATWNNLKNYLQSIFQSVSQNLWQLISQLLTFKEWSISGDAGVNAFGLTGTVKVELKFGP